MSSKKLNCSTSLDQEVYLHCTVIIALQDMLIYHGSFNFDSTSHASLVRAEFLEYEEKEREKEREV